MRFLRNSILVVALAGMTMAVPALAQTSSGYPAPCDASKVSKADVDRAHQVFLSGKGFLDEANYDKAISYFKDAYSIDCSVHGILPIIATAYERKGDKAAAIDALQEYLKRVPNAPDREVIQHRIKNLQDQLAQEKAAAAAAPPATTAPAATASAPSARPASTAPTTTAAPETPAGPGAHTIPPWIVVGVGGAAIVAGVALYVVGAGDVSTAEKTCPNHGACNDANARSTGNTGRTLETVGVVFGGVGAAAVVGGIVWHFMEKPAAASTTGTHLEPVLAPGYGGLSLGGRF